MTMTQKCHQNRKKLIVFQIPGTKQTKLVSKAVQLLGYEFNIEYL